MVMRRDKFECEVKVESKYGEVVKYKVRTYLNYFSTLYCSCFIYPFRCCCGIRHPSEFPARRKVYPGKGCHNSSERALTLRVVSCMLPCLACHGDEIGKHDGGLMLYMTTCISYFENGLAQDSKDGLIIDYGVHSQEIQTKRHAAPGYSVT